MCRLDLSELTLDASYISVVEQRDEGHRSGSIVV